MNDLPHQVILCIDDRATDAEMELLRSVLEKTGYRVLSATGAKRVLQLFCREQIDLILMEQKISAPSRDCTLAQLLKRLRPDVPLVIYTADWTQSLEDFRVADSFLSKLVSVEELLSAIRRLLGSGLNQAGSSLKEAESDYALDRSAA